MEVSPGGIASQGGIASWIAYASWCACVNQALGVSGFVLLLTQPYRPSDRGDHTVLRYLLRDDLVILCLDLCLEKLQGVLVIAIVNYTFLFPIKAS